MEDLLKLIREISNYYINLETLQNEYQTLLSNYIDHKKKEYYKKQAETKQKISKIFTTSENSGPTNLRATFKKNNSENVNKQTDQKKQSTETNKQSAETNKQSDKSKRNNDENWDTYTFYEPDQKREKLVEKTLQRLKPKTNLKKILKKIYHRLLLKLHPDRSTIQNSEKLSKKMIKCFNDAEYSFLFHMFFIIQLKIYLSEYECKLLMSFLKQEIRRLQVSLKILTENINKFKL